MHDEAHELVLVRDKGGDNSVLLALRVVVTDSITEQMSDASAEARQSESQKIWEKLKRAARDKWRRKTRRPARVPSPHCPLVLIAAIKEAREAAARREAHQRPHEVRACTAGHGATSLLHDDSRPTISPCPAGCTSVSTSTWSCGARRRQRSRRAHHVCVSSLRPQVAKATSFDDVFAPDSA